jgi:hypothetical protein
MDQSPAQHADNGKCLQPDKQRTLWNNDQKGFGLRQETLPEDIREYRNPQGDLTHCNLDQLEHSLADSSPMKDWISKSLN